MGQDLVPVGDNLKITALVTRVASGLRGIGRIFSGKLSERRSSMQHGAQLNDVEVVDVEYRVHPIDKTREVALALRERRYIDAAELLHGTNVNTEDPELLFLFGINRQELSALGMVFDFSNAVEKSANMGYADAQIEMARVIHYEFVRGLGVRRFDDNAALNEITAIP